MSRSNPDEHRPKDLVLLAVDQELGAAIQGSLPVRPGCKRHREWADTRLPFRGGKAESEPM